MRDTDTFDGRATDRLTLVTRHARVRALPFHSTIKELVSVGTLLDTDPRIRIGSDRKCRPITYRATALRERARELLVEAEADLAESSEVPDEIGRALDRLRELVSETLPHCDDSDVQSAQALETAGLCMIALMVGSQLALQMIDLAADAIDAVIYEQRHAAFDGVFAKIAIDLDIDYFEVVLGLYRDGRIDWNDVFCWATSDLPSGWETVGMQEMLDHLLPLCARRGEEPLLPGFLTQAEETIAEHLDEAVRLFSEGQLNPEVFRQVAVAAEMIDRNLTRDGYKSRKTGGLHAIVLRNLSLARMSHAVLSAFGTPSNGIAP